MASDSKTFDTAAKRWEGIGPYYAMFPIRFADSVVEEHTSVGDTVLDPFAGRGTAIFSAAAKGRRGIGVEISPVGWIYAKTKLGPAPQKLVEKRLREIAQQNCDYAAQARSLPRFFRMCFSPPIQRFLLAARANLNWRRRACDRTLMSILLVYLHGKKGQALSNQMRQTKSMAPQYAMRWWKENGSEPPWLDVEEFVGQRIRWRYAKGVLDTDGCRIYLGDSISLLPKLARKMHEKGVSKAKLLLTSPPYYGVTNYYYDQWLRLWLLGYGSDAYVVRGPYQGRFTHQARYRRLLKNVFSRASKIVSDDAIVYVRTSRHQFTLDSTSAALKEAFPGKHLIVQNRPYLRATQTHLFGDRSPKPGEVDLLLRSS